MLPVKKTSKCRTRTRRSHHAVKPVNYSICKNCNNAKLPHAVCGSCGYVNPNLKLDLGKES
ncbi:MAG: 50S ribosomal protein L32 [Sedimentisphaerales bacterium]|nr:50S ribosomal protein L32 [Sedimentisphaerales bacterium]